MLWLWLLELFVYVIMYVLEASSQGGSQNSHYIYIYKADKHKVHVVLTGCHSRRPIHLSVTHKPVTDEHKDLNSTIYVCRVLLWVNRRI
jgi:hypothetical protein